MPLPALIEIVSPAHPAAVHVTIPGSKSITNRGLVLAALAEGRVILRAALWSEDTEIMVECLRRLGFDVGVEADPDEESNCMITVEGENADESPYVAMTSKMLEVFPHEGGEFLIEPDCSSASYFWAAGALLPDTRLSVANWPESGWQIDARFLDFCRQFREPAAGGPREVSRLDDLGDAIMTTIVLAPFLDHPTKF